MHIRIEGTDLPGRRAGAQAERLRRDHVHVGVQRGSRAGQTEVVDRMPADAPRVTWELEVTSREVDGLLDVGGPWVHGRPGARFLYLSWGVVSSAEPAGFAMFRRAKLLFGDIATGQLRAAHEGGGVLVARLGLTDQDGGPRCARVRPPDIEWQLE